MDLHFSCIDVSWVCWRNEEVWRVPIDLVAARVLLSPGGLKSDLDCIGALLVVFINSLSITYLLENPSSTITSPIIWVIIKIIRFLVRNRTWPICCKEIVLIAIWLHGIWLVLIIAVSIVLVVIYSYRVVNFIGSWWWLSILSSITFFSQVDPSCVALTIWVILWAVSICFGHFRLNADIIFLRASCDSYIYITAECYGRDLPIVSQIVCFWTIISISTISIKCFTAVAGVILARINGGVPSLSVWNSIHPTVSQASVASIPRGLRGICAWVTVSFWQGVQSSSFFS